MQTTNIIHSMGVISIGAKLILNGELCEVISRDWRTKTFVVRFANSVEKCYHREDVKTCELVLGSVDNPVTSFGTCD